MHFNYNLYILLIYQLNYIKYNNKIKLYKNFTIMIRVRFI